MSYGAIARMQADYALFQRITACVAVEKIAPMRSEEWVNVRRWDFAAQPGWSEAWAYAENGGNLHVGEDESVITDPMILAAVQSIGAPEEGPLE